MEQKLLISKVNPCQNCGEIDKKIEEIADEVNETIDQVNQGKIQTPAQHRLILLKMSITMVQIGQYLGIMMARENENEGDFSKSKYYLFNIAQGVSQIVLVVGETIYKKIPEISKVKKTADFGKLYREMKLKDKVGTCKDCPGINDNIDIQEIIKTVNSEIDYLNKGEFRTYELHLTSQNLIGNFLIVGINLGMVQYLAEKSNGKTKETYERSEKYLFSIAETMTKVLEKISVLTYNLVPKV